GAPPIGCSQCDCEAAQKDAAEADEGEVVVAIVGSDGDRVGRRQGVQDRDRSRATRPIRSEGEEEIRSQATAVAEWIDRSEDDDADITDRETRADRNGDDMRDPGGCGSSDAPLNLDSQVMEADRILEVLDDLRDVDGGRATQAASE